MCFDFRVLGAYVCSSELSLFEFIYIVLILLLGSLERLKKQVKKEERLEK